MIIVTRRGCGLRLSWMAHLLRIVLFIGEERGDVEHDLNPSPIRIDGLRPREVMDSVESALVAVKPPETHALSQDLEKVVKGSTIVIVVQDLLLRVLPFLDINDADLELRLDEHLRVDPTNQTLFLNPCKHSFPNSCSVVEGGMVCGRHLV